MSMGPLLLDQLKGFADLEQQIVRRSQTFDASTATEFVQIRRVLSETFATLGAALSADDYLKSNPELMLEVSRSLSAFRIQYSVVQGEWPVVRMKDELTAYRHAERLVSQRAQEFWQCVESKLGFKK